MGRKGSIRNYTISYASARNRAYFQELAKLEIRLSSLISQQQNRYDQEREKELGEAKAELNAFLMPRAEFLVHRAREIKYLNGNRTSSVLSRKIHCNDKKADLSPLKTERVKWYMIL